jgi:hypothetical protein
MANSISIIINPQQRGGGSQYLCICRVSSGFRDPGSRIPMSRAPRQLLTGWVSHSRPIGCPQMTWGRTLENALKSKGISKDFDVDRHCQEQVEVETADSLHSQTS